MQVKEITRSLSRNAPISPVKGRMAADRIRGLPVQRALETLEFSPQKAAGILWKTLRAAVSNAEENHAADADDLVVARVEVSDGMTFKRARFGARGRVSRIKRRRSHVLVTVADADEFKRARSRGARSQSARSDSGTESGTDSPSDSDSGGQS